jgi:hypothetical protein
MNAAGAAVRRLTHDSDDKSRPVRPPDSRKFALINRSDRETYLMSADGTHSRRLIAGVDSAGGLA